MENLFLSIIIISTYIFILFALFFRFILPTYKRESSIMTIDELYSAISSFINFEIQLYEDNIFTEHGNLDSNSFNNYYYAIVESIVNNISDIFFKRASVLMSKESIVELISRNVHVYLTEKLIYIDNTETEE